MRSRCRAGRSTRLLRSSPTRSTRRAKTSSSSRTRASARSPCRTCARPSHTPTRDGLHLHELVEAEAAPLAAVARLPVAAKRRRALVGRTVDVDVAGPDALGNATGALHIAGGDVAGEPVGRVVGDAD